MSILVVTKPPDLPGPVWDTYPGLVHSRVQGRSWWAVRYTDGRIINEWEPEADWLNMPKRGMQRLRLYCPDGRYVELGDTADAGGRFLQFKVGLRLVSIGQAVLAQIIGLVRNPNGDAALYAWEPTLEGGHINGPFEDNVHCLAYHNLGPLALDALGIRL